LGIDIAAIRLDPTYRNQCEENGITFLSAEKILNHSAPDLNEYVAMGIPLFTYQQTEHDLAGEIGHEGRSQLIVMPVRLVETPPDILPTKHPRVFFRPKETIAPELASGMSGAPIFGIRFGVKPLAYRLVAMQFGFRDDGLIVASPAEEFVPLVRDWLAAE
jgi:hypothetical protein